MSLSSEEVNFLIYRYLVESGFNHSAFAFGTESQIIRTSIDSKRVPPGSLIKFIQKGLQFTELNAHICDDGSEILCEEGFSVVHPHECKAKGKKLIFDAYEAYEADYGELEIADNALYVLQEYVPPSDTKTGEAAITGKYIATSVAWRPNSLTMLATGISVLEGKGESFVGVWDLTHRHSEREKEIQNHLDVEEVNVIRVNNLPLAAEQRKDKMEQLMDERKRKEEKLTLVARQAQTTSDSTTTTTTTTTTATTASTETLKKRKVGQNGDSVATTASSADTTAAPQGYPRGDSVTGLSWNANGKLLASASYSGAVTIWDLSASHDRRVQNVAKSSKRRQLQDTMLAANESETMSQHATCLSNINPCSALAFAPSNFSKNVTNLAVCRLNGQVQIYGVDVSRKSDKPLVSAHSYTNHTGPVLAAVWLDAHVLATCGVDGFVYVYDTQKDTIRHFKANTEVNTVRWLKPKIAKKGKKYNNKSRDFSVDVKNQAVFLVAGDEAGVIYLLSCDEIVPGNKGSSSSASSSSSSSSSSNSNSKKRKQTDDNKQGSSSSSSSSSSNSSEEGYMTALFTTQGHKRGVVTLAVNTQTEVAAVLNDGSDDEGAKPAPRSAGVAYTPLVVASGGLDTAVKVWEIDTTNKKLTEIYSFNNHIHPVTSVTFSAELPYLLASSSHDRVHAWNIKEGVMVRTFRPQEQEEGGVNSVQWADKGRKIAAAMSQGQVLVLDIIE